MGETRIGNPKYRKVRKNGRWVYELRHKKNSREHIKKLSKKIKISAKGKACKICHSKAPKSAAKTKACKICHTRN